MTSEPKDWVAWHAPYDVPGSRLARRLATVQQRLGEALEERDGDITLISMCAGQGRDVIPVLARYPRRDRVRALLVELDERNAATARASAREAGLERLEVQQGDAALTENYAAYAPADIVLACGIFGNISPDDIKRTVEHLPMLCAPGATVLWTRGRFDASDDVADRIRAWFEGAGFEELHFDAPDDTTFTVGTNRLIAPPSALQRGVRLFTFIR